jgi:hypothetical protein
MITRPFPLQQIPIDNAGSLGVEVVFSDISSSQAVVDHIGTVFSALARIASTGALSGQGSISLEIDERGRTGNMCTWSFASREIPASFSGILVNLVHGASNLIPKAIDELRLRASPGHTVPADGSIWPLVSLLKPPFAVVNMMEGRRLDLVISFEHPTTTDGRAPFLAVYNDWVTLSVAGGFCDADHPVGDAYVIASDVPYADLYQISFLHDRYGLDLRAVNILLAAFAKLHWSGTAIKEVVLS